MSRGVQVRLLSWAPTNGMRRATSSMFLASYFFKRNIAHSIASATWFSIILLPPRCTKHHIALCCLEGSTMSNLVHRRRRCARIVHYMILLPGRQYARGWERSLSTQSKDIVVAPGEPILYCQRQLFCFVAFRQPAGQTRQVVMFKQASLLAWMNITTWLQGRKPRESNKLFDLYLPPQDRYPSNPFNPC